MTLLSGGVSEMAMPTNGQVANLQAYYQAYPTAMNRTFDVGISYNQPSYYDYYTPQTAYSMPVSYNNATANNNYDYSSINYSPVAVNNSAMNVSAPTFNPVAPSGIIDQAGAVQIGGRTYAPNQVIASADLTYAPGGFAAGRPQYDSLPDTAYGYSATAMPDKPGSNQQTFRMGSDVGEMPDMLPAPDTEQMGMPNPYKVPVQAPDYFNGQANQSMMAIPDQVINNAPNRADYYPPAQSMARPSNPFLRAIWAMPGQARQRAGINAAAEDRYQGDSNRYYQAMSTIMPGITGGLREISQQEGADYRLNRQAQNQGALSVLTHMLDQEDKKHMSTSQALDYLAKAFLLPPAVIEQNGQPAINRQKLALIRAAAPVLGLNENDIYGLSHVQDMNAAEAQQQASIATRQKAFELKRMQQMLPHEIGLLKAHIAQSLAQANNLNADARTTNFNVRQRQAVAKYERWGIIANSFKAISDMLVAKGTRQATIDKATLENKRLVAETLKNEMTARAIPEEAAAKLASAIATLSFNSSDATSKHASAMLLQTLEDAISPGQATQQPRPTRRPVPQLPAPSPSYFSGGPLSGNTPVATVAGD